MRCANSMFLTHHNLQGSQTAQNAILNRLTFLTHHNLQGSQTKINMNYKTAKVSYPS